jgi:glycosyltransferase involved in cell wall biosynthesis
MSLAEAMLAGCVPVVSARGAIPEVVGPCGVYVDERSPDALAEGIREGLESSDALGPQARNRITENFPLSVRREGLLHLVDDLGGLPGIVV